MSQVSPTVRPSHEGDPSHHDFPQRRVSRACDQCNQSRRKCDGRLPCRCCVQSQRHCQYRRQQKRRGRSSKANGYANAIPQTVDLSTRRSDFVHPRNVGNGSLHADDHQNHTAFDLNLDMLNATFDYEPLTMQDEWSFGNSIPQSHPFQMVGQDASMPHGYSTHEHTRDHTARSISVLSPEPVQGEPVNSRRISSSIGAPELAGSRLIETHRQSVQLHMGRDLAREPILDGSIKSRKRRRNYDSEFRETNYPVLEPILPMLRKIMPDSLSVALLEAYFDISLLKRSPKISFVPWSVFKKESFLRRENPRRTSRVLLASMLWLSAQEADVPWLNANIAQRKHIRRQLLRLTTGLLKPLSEVAFVGCDGLEFEAFDELHSEYFDECMAYAHLAMVTSASAFRRASLRWWNMAFSLAREINLHRTQAVTKADTPSSPSSGSSSFSDHSRNPAPTNNQDIANQTETQHERSRAWWFLYTMDRHISLLFNKSLSLLDSECSNLERLHSDALGESYPEIPSDRSSSVGPSYLCAGPHFFHFFTPISSLLGEIIYFTQARTHPRFGISPWTTEDWTLWEAAIASRLDEYKESLEILLRDPASAGAESDTIAPDPSYRSQVTYAYGQFFVHALHFCLAGQWDPLSILDQTEESYTSTRFQNMLSHALSSAQALEKTLELDPGLQFMAFYVGIYLFQLSIPLLCVADRLGPKAGETSVKACQVLIHGHEICTSQLSCDYQTAMVTALRAALLEMQGRVVDTTGQNALARRRLLQKFDWTAEGKGVAC